MKPFQAQLDAAVKNYPGVKLRLEWAPRLTEARVIDKQGNLRVYRKYPLLGMETREYHVGTSYRRNGKIIAYQKMGGLMPPNMKLGDMAIAHFERVNHSVHIFVIEKKLPDDYARQEWEKKRALSRAKIGADIFGPFPQEGVWVWFDDISEHRLVNGSATCCDIAATAGKGGVRCQGLYREPDARDIENVRAALKDWDSRKNLVDSTSLIEQAARDYTAAVEEWEGKEMLAILQETRELTNLDKIAQEKTRVIGGTKRPLHTTPY